MSGELDLVDAVEVAPRLRRTLVTAAVVACVLLGAFLRVWALGRQTVNADEAVVGLVARDILHGHFPVFYPGQQYGGVEPYAVALVFLVLGQSNFTLTLTPVLLSAVGALLVWRVGRRAFGPRIGVAAACAIWVWPEVFVWQSTLEYGFRFVVLDMGLVALLFALDLGDAAPSRRRLVDAGVVGLALGVGFWASPEIAYFAVPIVGWLVVRFARRRARVAGTDVVVAVAAFAVGALPWIVHNAATRWASFHTSGQPDPGFLNHLEVVRYHVLPTYLGLAVPITGQTLLPTALVRTIEYLALAVGLVLVIRLLRTGRGAVVALMALWFPIAYAASPFSWYWKDGRYGLYLAPVIALLVPVLVDESVAFAARRRRRSEPSSRRRTWALVGLVAVMAAATLGDARIVSPFKPSGRRGLAQTWTAWTANPTSYAATLADTLQRHGVSDVIAGYWVAAPVMFASHGALTVTDVRYDRVPRYLAEVEAHDPAYLFVRTDFRARAAVYVGSPVLDPGCAVASDRCFTPGLFLDYLDRHHIGSHKIFIGAFEVIIPAVPVSPEAAFRAEGVHT